MQCVSAMDFLLFAIAFEPQCLENAAYWKIEENFVEFSIQIRGFRFNSHLTPPFLTDLVAKDSLIFSSAVSRINGKLCYAMLSYHFQNELDSITITL